MNEIEKEVINMKMNIMITLIILSLLFSVLLSFKITTIGNDVAFLVESKENDFINNINNAYEWISNNPDNYTTGLLDEGVYACENVDIEANDVKMQCDYLNELSSK